MLVIAVALLVCGCASGCSGSSENVSGTKGKSVEVTQATWHSGKWPFSVSRGILGCHMPPFPGAVTFNVDGTTYAVNGDAENQAAEEHYEDINPIWLKEPSRVGGEDLRADIGGMIDLGLKLCKEAEHEKE